jgi:hypothetical protein
MDAQVNQATDVAFFWSAVATLPGGWMLKVRPVMGHPDFRVTTEYDWETAVGEIHVYDCVRFSDGDRSKSVHFRFHRGRGAGQVQRRSGDVAILAALRIAAVLDLDLSDAAGKALPKHNPLTWLSQIVFTGTADEVEALAEQLGLIPTRYSLAELTRPDAEKEPRLFF